MKSVLVFLFIMISLKFHGQCDLNNLIVYNKNSKIFTSDEFKGTSSPLIVDSEDIEFTSKIKIGKVEELIPGIILWIKFTVFSDRNTPLKSMKLTLKNKKNITLSEDNLFLKGEVTSEKENIKLLGENISSMTFSASYAYLLSKKDILKLTNSNIHKISFGYDNISKKESRFTGDRKLSSKSGKKINKSVKCLVSELGI
jgi:hypothetical protein